MDLSQLSTEDLLALKAGDLSKVSTEGLLHLKQQSAPKAEQQGFFKSFMDTATGLKAAPSAGRFAAGETGDEASRAALLKAQESGGDRTSWEDVHDLSGLVDFAKQTAGSSAGYLAAPGAAATAAKLLTKGPGIAKGVGYGVLGAQYLVDALGRQAQTEEQAVQTGQPMQDRSFGKAAVAAAGETALDVVGMKFFEPVFKAFPMVRNLLGEAGEKAGKEAEDALVTAFRNKTLSLKDGVAKGIAGGLAFEVPQEIAQQALERWQAGLSLSDEDARKEYTEAAAGAVLLGGTLGGLHGVIDTQSKKMQAKDIIASRKAEEDAKVAAEKAKTAAAAAPAAPGTPAGTPAAGTYEGISVESEIEPELGALYDPVLEYLSTGHAKSAGELANKIPGFLTGPPDKDGKPTPNKNMANAVLAGLEAKGLVVKNEKNNWRTAESETALNERNLARELLSKNSVVPSDYDEAMGQLDANREADIEAKAAAGIPKESKVKVKVKAEKVAKEPAVSFVTPELVTQATEHVRSGGKASVPQLRAHFGLGASDAAKLHEALQTNGVLTKNATTGRYEATPIKPEEITLTDREQKKVAFAMSTGLSEAEARQNILNIRAKATNNAAPVSTGNTNERATGEGDDAAVPALAASGFQSRPKLSLADVSFRRGMPEQTTVARSESAPRLPPTPTESLRAPLDIDSLKDIRPLAQSKQEQNILEAKRTLLADAGISTPESLDEIKQDAKVLFDAQAITEDAYNRILNLSKQSGASVDGAKRVIVHAMANLFADRADSLVERGVIKPEIAFRAKAFVQPSVERRVQKKGTAAEAFKSEFTSPQEQYEELTDRIEMLTEDAIKFDAQGRAFAPTAEDIKAGVGTREQGKLEEKSLNNLRDILDATTDPEKAAALVKTDALENMDIDPSLLTTEEGKQQIRDTVEKYVRAYHQLVTAARKTPKTRTELQDKIEQIEIARSTAGYTGVQQALNARNIKAALDEIYAKYTGPGADAEARALSELALHLSTVDLSNVSIQFEDDANAKKAQFVQMRERNELANYDPKSNTLFFTRSRGVTDRIILHELIHAATVKTLHQFETDPSQLSRYEREAAEQLHKVYLYSKRRFTTVKAPLSNIYEFVAYGLTDSSFQAKLAGVSAPKIAKFTIGRALNKFAKSLWDLFADALAMMHGILDEKTTFTRWKFEDIEGITKNPGYAGNLLLETAEAFKRILAAPTGGIELKPLAAERKKAEVNMATPEQFLRKRAEELASQNGRKPFIDAMTDGFTQMNGVSTFENLATNFQNDRRPLKTLQEAMKMAGKLIVGGATFNDVYDQIVRSSQLAHFNMANYLDRHIADMHKAIDMYSKASGLDINATLARLDAYLMALHEPERRQVKYEMNVPLNNTKRLKFGKLKGIKLDDTATAATHRETIKDALNSPDTTPEMAKEYRRVLKFLVAKYTDDTVQGFSPNNFKTVDINDPKYNVVGQHPPSFFSGLRDMMKADPHQGEIQMMISAMKQIQENTIKLDKEANYWSAPVDNMRAFYGYDNYVPFKGKVASEVSESDRQYEFGGERLGGEFSEFTRAAEGRDSDADNILLQSIADGAKSAMRAGRKNVAVAIRNAVKDKSITGRVVKTITFAQRYKGVDLAEERGPNKLFVYNADGTIDVLEIKEQAIRNAIRRVYEDSSSILQGVGKVTSFMGKMHTRYNVGFAPYNFVRDTLTNAGIISAEDGLGAGGRYLRAIASNILNKGMYKSFKMAKAYSDGDVAQMRELAKKDSYSKDVLEWIENGGRNAYVMGVANQTHLKDLMHEISGNKFVQTGAQLNKMMDIYGDIFEFTSRASAYSVFKADEMAANIKKGMSKKDAEQAAMQTAAARAKELTNFESVGRLGKEAGAFYMFFRPAATGAVRAMDALAPAFQNIDKLVALLPANIKEDAAALAQYKAKFAEKKTNARNLMMALAGAGFTMYMLAFLMSGDDDQGRNRVAMDDMAIWTRNLRLPIPGTDKFVQVPWGYGPGAFAAAGAQVGGLIAGKSTLGEGMINLSRIGLDSFMPLPFSQISPIEKPMQWAFDSVAPSAARPFLEFIMDTDSLGREIYNNRQSKYGDAYTGGDNIPEAYRGLARYLAETTNGDLNIQPNTLYFFANNYADGISKLAHGFTGLSMAAAGNKDIDFKTDMPLLSSFVGKKSNYDGRQFSELRTKMEQTTADLKMFAATGNQEQYNRYVERHPNSPQLVQYYNKVVNGRLRDLSEMKNKVIANRSITPKDRKDILDQINLEMNMRKKNFIETYKYWGGTY